MSAPSSSVPTPEQPASSSFEDFAERVLDVVERIPPGQVLSYGDVAELLGDGGPRRVGRVLARDGSAVPWWRVLRADGTHVDGLREQALDHLRAEGTAVRGEGPHGRVDMDRARWDPSGSQPPVVAARHPKRSKQDGEFPAQASSGQFSSSQPRNGTSSSVGE
jgi:alkylated DNA nucleotide flippase Atl1